MDDGRTVVWEKLPVGGAVGLVYYSGALYSLWFASGFWVIRARNHTGGNLQERGTMWRNAHS